MYLVLTHIIEKRYIVSSSLNKLFRVRNFLSLTCYWFAADHQFNSCAHERQCELYYYTYTPKYTCLNVPKVERERDPATGDRANWGFIFMYTATDTFFQTLLCYRSNAATTGETVLVGLRWSLHGDRSIEASGASGPMFGRLVGQCLWTCQGKKRRCGCIWAFPTGAPGFVWSRPTTFRVARIDLYLCLYGWQLQLSFCVLH